MPITLWDEALLQGGRYTVRPGLRLVGPAGGDVIDVTDHLLGFSIAATMASPSIDISIDLIRGGTGLTLGDGALGSLSPYLDPSAYTFPSGRHAIDPVVSFIIDLSIETDFSNTHQGVFMQGLIDHVDVAPGGGQIKLVCRDLSARYQDVLMPGTAIYGEAGGKEAALVMEDMMLAVGMNPAEFITRVPSFDEFMVEPYPVGGVTLLEAMRTLAQASGRDVRELWIGGQWNLTYYDPDRARLGYDLLVIPQASVGIRELSYGIADVRNSVDVYYRDLTTGLPVGPIHAEDAASIARYGLRHFEVFLNPVEMIRDTPHAQAFADAAVADQKDPFVSHKIEMPFNPTIQLNDIHLYSGRWAENVTDLTLAVMSYTHTYRAAQKGNDGVARTVVGATGKPRATLRDYRHSKPPAGILTTVAPTTEYAPEGTIIYIRAA